ncbi:MAG: type II secretion system ATPase GspE [Candidatus Omnitrophica bacterium]|nr:type II secretion system ATPase GspE [Candidatus Omnitrophota bacterium]MBL7210450.1 type II secretion system ATPase GspE [Candidatus Omnitrophota bacterium]
MEIVELLLKQGIITPEQIQRAKEETKRTGITLERALQKLGLLNEEEIAKARANALGVPYMDLDGYIIDAELVKLIPEQLAKKYRTVPLFKISDTLTVAMSDPRNIEALDNIRKVSKVDLIDPVLASDKGIERILNVYYEAAGSAEDIIKSMDKQNPLEAMKMTAAEAAEDAPVIKLVNIMITEAVKERASDIHIEPEQEALRARYRVDGVLYERHTFPKKIQDAIVSRIKILAAMDIAENRKPQDGKIRLKVENKDLDIRVSTFPTVHGENVVMRLLHKSSILLSLEDLGFSKDNLDAFEKLIRQPNGIILVTGPTGSGKTTTLYAALTTVSSMEKNIITIEDPVEYELPLIRQTPVNPKADMTFANGLRSILRQDPDVIMVGEIRDKETAEIAIQASMTGHLVLSTLHTNDAPSSLTRLIDMGIEPFLISSSVSGILAQRLVRQICPKCKEKYTPAGNILKDSGASAEQEFYRGKGCDNCKKTGFMGRIGIFEFLPVNEEIKKMVNERNSADQIRKKAIEMGMKTLREDGLEKVKSGLTTLEEVVRVTQV